MPKIIVKLGDNVIQKYFFVNETMSIGRAPDNEIVIENLAVSRAHSVIRNEEDHYLVSDLGSSNGTYVNGVRVRKTELMDQDVISIGKHKLFFYDHTPRDNQRISKIPDMDITMLVQPTVSAKVVVTKGRQKGLEYGLGGTTTKLGRGTDNDVRLSDWFVSKNHALIEKRENDFFIRDLGSWRHTMVNQNQVEEERLVDGDLLQLGPTVQLSFHILSDVGAANGAACVPVELENNTAPVVAEDALGPIPGAAVVDEDSSEPGEIVEEAAGGDDDHPDHVMEDLANISVKAAADQIRNKTDPPKMVSEDQEHATVSAEEADEEAKSSANSDDPPVNIELESNVWDSDDRCQSTPLDCPDEVEPEGQQGNISNKDEALAAFDAATSQLEEQGSRESAYPNPIGQDEDGDQPDDEIRMWERALKNKSPIIRKQAAKRLKRLTGKDYEY
jgi:pSer/pThr/pTyr-binding forkhead associated (FHA) protein